MDINLGKVQRSYICCDILKKFPTKIKQKNKEVLKQINPAL